MKYCSRVSVFKASTCFSSRFFFFFITLYAHWLCAKRFLKWKDFETQSGHMHTCRADPHSLQVDQLTVDVL